ncbi:riboflavin synthase subunit alpha [Chlamydia trachomatis]|uniref:Riboflavin synthase n=2 Tax=Chlamydia muridarum TaxID=83560 RepID=RISA_CHLMU|nr:riboflavin synthase subunit alpha [Chlamydia muridarum]Q9PJZ1.1 RecName: Full=Riboflavin synthase; Short=RS [Chlamydia muridarum str. Nigg]UFT34914.1 riboflavin synthase subunit alpha [Chlamydia trachomatis]AAF39502.1 riboflavin synthase, alpha subunit [Chlamydia muridarum str. Nigg]AHH23071.1 riboflavin synthase subunit alpha [Chlamydia muridarum str. Nigg3 CMUT3-5]AHH23996.1 riboflavin synthase subunit alpha [Chlamydia muridarum str. Nigg CM972]AID38203.1 riboflavin synthase subunit alph
MFSGIIQEVARVDLIHHYGDSMEIGIFARNLVDGVPGSSIAVDGICLTLVKREFELLFFDVTEETMACTTIKNYTVGSMVNLERSVRLGDEIGGHFVSGHVCGVGTIIAVEKSYMFFKAPTNLVPYVLEKGFIAIDGISLTIAQVRGDIFSVSVIPETRARTSLGYKQVGSHVNMEPDMMTKMQVDTVMRFQAEKIGK